MRILIDVYLPGLQNIRRDVPELGAWDTLGVSEELDFSLKQFPKTAFISAKNLLFVRCSTGNGKQKAKNFPIFAPT